MRNRDQLVPYSALTRRPRGAHHPARTSSTRGPIVVPPRAHGGGRRPAASKNEIGTEARIGYRLVGPVD